MVNTFKRVIAFLLPSLFFGLLMFSALTAHAMEYERTPVGSTITSPVEIFVAFDDIDDEGWASWQSNTPEVLSWRVWIQNQLGSEDKFFSICRDYPDDLLVAETIALDDGEYSAVSVRGYETTDCTGSIVATGDLFPEYADGETIFTVSSGGGGGGSDLGAMIDNANVQFLQTTGFNIPNVVSWGGDNLIKLFIGSIVAIIYHMRYWIVALIIIGTIIYFSYRAFRFFKH